MTRTAPRRRTPGGKPPTGGRSHETHRTRSRPPARRRRPRRRPAPRGREAVDPPRPRDTVTVSGTGVVTAVPDRAQISAGVESRAPTARAALAANAAAMRKVLDALRARGGKDVTTQTVSLSTAFDEQGEPDGFVASNIASAETSLAGAGALIDAAVAAGANTVYGPSLSRSDAEELYREALEKRGRGRASGRADDPRRRPPARARSRHGDDRDRRSDDPDRSRRRRPPRRLDPGRLRPAGDHGDGERHLRAEVRARRGGSALAGTGHKRSPR